MRESEHFEAAIAGLEAQRGVLGDDAVNAAISALRSRLDRLSSREGQRRYATVLFADLVGFTTMSEKLDPEEIRDATNEIWTVLDAIVAEHGGLVDKHIGDALMAIFGVPIGKEDDGERAVRASLEMQKALRDMAHSFDMRMRIGLHTGLVAWGSVGISGEQTAIGDTVNVASRLESIAPEGGILISEDVCRHVRGRFVLERHPPLVLKGRSEPIVVYAVLQERPQSRRRPRQELAAVETPILGREQELRELCEEYCAVAAGGRARFRTVLGHAGQGKTRLMSAYSDWLELASGRPETDGDRAGRSAGKPASGSSVFPEGSSGRPLVIRANAHSGCSERPFGLLREILFSLLEIDERDPPERQRDRIFEGLHEMMGGEARSVARVMASILGVSDSTGDTGGGPNWDAKSSWETVLDSVARILTVPRFPDPAVLLLEDVHRADSTSLDLLEELVERCRDKSLLVVATARYGLIDKRPSWFAGGEAFGLLKLGELNREQSTALVKWLFEERRGESSSKVSELIESIVERGGGNPFYLQEMVRLFLEKGTLCVQDPKKESSLPGTLKAVFQTRIDMLSDFEKDLLRRASVLGDEFTTKELEALGEKDEPDPRPALMALVARDYFRVLDDEDGGEERYLFGHSLVKEFGYQTIPLKKRALLHEKTARWLMTRPQAESAEAMTIAVHLQAAGKKEEAASWHLRAGQYCLEVGAVGDAVEITQRGVEGASGLPHEEHLKALDCLTRGYRYTGQPKAAHAACEKMLELARGDAAWEARSLIWLSCLWIDSGDANRATAAVEDAQKLAARAGDANLIGRISYQRAFLAQHQGRFEESLRICERAMGEQNLDPHTHTTLRQWCGLNLYRMGRLADAARAYEIALTEARGIGSSVLMRRIRSGLAVVFQSLGRLDEAIREFEEIVDETRAVGDRILEGSALNSLAECLRLQGSYGAARSRYEQARQIFEERGSSALQVVVFNLGLCDIQTGMYEAALARLDSISPGTWLQGLYMAARLACVAALEDLETFDSELAELVALVADNGRVDLDIAGLAEHAGDRMIDHSDAERAREAYSLAEKQWRGLERMDDVRRVEGKLVSVGL